MSTKFYWVVPSVTGFPFFCQIDRVILRKSLTNCYYDIKQFEDLFFRDTVLFKKELVSLVCYLYRVSFVGINSQ